MHKNEFYSVLLRRKIRIPDSDIDIIRRKDGFWLIGKYYINGVRHEAWKKYGHVHKR